MLRICFIILLFCSPNGFSTEMVMQNNKKHLATAAQKMVTFTCDDVPHAGPPIPLNEILANNKKLLTILKNNHIPSIGFVNEKLIFQFPGETKQRIGILQLWLDEEFELGNHTYSHWPMLDIPLKDYKTDVLRNEAASGTLMDQKGLKLRYFRHPYLITGPTLAYKNQFEHFLSAHGYTVAPITIELSDYKYNLIYGNAKQKNDKKTMRRIAQEYLDFTAKKIDFVENFSQQLLGYQVRQILLFHDNEINADYLQDIITLFKNKNYTFISLEEALKDKAYQLPDKYYGPIGRSWLFHWAENAGKISEPYVLKEPQPSHYIEDAYENLLKAHSDADYENKL